MVHRLWRKPELHHNLEDYEHQASWLELFYDLVYVAVLIQLGNILSDDVSWAGLGRFAVLFAPIWWAWSNFGFYMNRFRADDVAHRLIIALQIFFIAWIGASVGGAFAQLSTQFVLCYVGFRVTMIALYWRTYRHAPETRELVSFYIIAFHVVGAVAWLGSLLLPSEWRFTVWLGTFFWEVGVTQWPRLRRLHERFPLHLEHMRERFGTLTLLVLGETFIKSITSGDSLELSRDALLFSFPGVMLLFGLWWLYFEDTEDSEGQVIHRANPASWLYTHLPLSMALVGFGVGVKKLFASVYEGHLEPEYVVLYCGSLIVFALAMVALNLIGAKASRHQRALVRLAMALTVALIMVLNLHGSPLWFAFWAFLVVVAQVWHDLYLARYYEEDTSVALEP